MVGASLLSCLRKKGYENIITRTHSELDLTRQAEVEAFFDFEKPKYVFLAAAKVGGILANDTYKADFIYNNIMIAANVIHSSYKCGVKKLLNLGSSCIYPKFAQQPMKEGYLLTGSLEPTNEPYAIAKISALKLCRYYNEQYGTDYISVMPTNLYGPNDNFNLETAHVLPAVMRKLHLARLLKSRGFEQIRSNILKTPLGFGVDSKAIVSNDETITNALNKLGISAEFISIWGAGEVYREFMHVDDLADACLFLMDNCSHRDVGEFVNIGTAADIMIKDLAVMTGKIVGFRGEIRHDITKPDGTPKKLLDVGRARDLGWTAKIDLEEGIRKVYDWYCSTE